MKNKNLNLYGIYYNEETRLNLDAELTPLDNTSGPKHLFESWPILNFLAENSLVETQWYGFLSPKYTEKTGLTRSDIEAGLARIPDQSEVFLFSSHFPQAAYSLNVWLQGDVIHPGLMDITQDLAFRAGYNVDLQRSITTLDTAVFSHYLVAKPVFWREWSRIVNIYFDMMAKDESLANMTTDYRESEMSIHTFVIERIPSLILVGGKAKGAYDTSCYDKQMSQEALNTKLLYAMDRYKRNYIKTLDQTWLDLYRTALHGLIRVDRVASDLREKSEA